MRRRLAAGRGTDRGPLACVLGEIDLVQTLHLAGIRVAVTAAAGEPARYSRAVETILERFDPILKLDAAVESLIAFARRQSESPVLYYDADWDLLLVSRQRKRLSEWFRFVVAEEELVEDLVDKERFQTLSERLDLPVPASRCVSAAQWPDDLGLRYPLVVKPLTRDHATWRPLARAKAIHIETPAELSSLRGKLAESDLDVLVQEGVPGPESRIESYHVYVDDSGEIAGDFTGRKLRTYPSKYGYSTALTTSDSAEVRELGRELVGRLGLRGVAKFDFKRDVDGKLLLLEVNPRFNLWHHLAAHAGVNLPALVYADLTGRPRPPITDAKPGVKWCSLPHDMQAARSGGVSAVRWLRWVISCDVISGFAWDDPLPLPRAALWRLGRRVRSR